MLNTPYTNPHQHDREQAEVERDAREARRTTIERFFVPSDREVHEELARRVAEMVAERGCETVGEWKRAIREVLMENI